MKPYRTFIFGAFLSIVPLLSSSAIAFWAVRYSSQIAEFDFNTWLLLSIALVLSSALALTPPTFLALVFGYFLGFSALGFLFPINLLAIVLVYVVVQRLNQDDLRKLVSDNPKAQKLLEGLQNSGWKLVFFTKLSPVLPFALTNFIFSISRLSLRNILIGGFLGMIPRTILAVWAGSQAKILQQLLEDPNQDKLMRWGAAILLGVSVWGLVQIVMKARAKSS